MTEALGLPDAGRGGALAGVVIVELAGTPAGELAGGLLADLGATVVKIEPHGGSPMRQRGPGLDGEDSLAFQSENRGKHSVQAELRELATEPWLARLLATADALIEDLGPGRLEAAGLSPEELERRNPRLVTLRISPFGQTGPLAGERGDDRIAQAFSGDAVRHRIPRPRAAGGHDTAGRELDRHPRRERAPDGDLPRPPQRPRPGRGHRPLPDRAADAGRGGRSPRSERGGGRAPRHRVAHRGPGERVPDAGRRMDRGVRRGRPALRPPLRGDRGPRRAEGPALRHARRASPEPAGLRRAGRLLDRSARPRRRRGPLREGRRGRHRGALRR